MVVPVVLRGLPGTSTRNRPHGTSTSKPVVPVSYVVVLRVAALGRHGLLLARLVRVLLGGLEELPRLLAELRRILVAVRVDRVLRCGLHDLVLLADDRERAVDVARPPAAVGHHSCHWSPPGSRG